MSEKKDVMDITTVSAEVVDTVEEDRMVVIFSKPFEFEGKVYDKLDLNALDDMTAADMIAANKILEKTGSFSFMPEMSLEYACVIAARASKLPLEFFKKLHPKDAIKVKNRVTAFFYGAD